ncbi:MAG: glycosyltransferase [Gammaproteobacteria bacterium]|nr:MAG: glycosyltransferase [Gammaproteobacteria bacterium]TND06439.1 MAG: glycosyltransferase [Gammaproteobacteria bacterium]
MTDTVIRSIALPANNHAASTDDASGARGKIDDQRWARRREIFLTWCGIVFTLATGALVIGDQYPVLLGQIEAGRYGDAAAHGAFLVIIAFLVYGSLVYQTTRLGYIKRRRAHRPAARHELDALYQETPPLAILVPSYKEERRTILQTLMSAALQEYPNRRVVLLIDNQPDPTSTEEAALLDAARKLPAELNRILGAPARVFSSAFAGFTERQQHGTVNGQTELKRLADLWQQAAAWFERAARDYPVHDHTDRFYVAETLSARADTHRAHARVLRARIELGVAADADELRVEYQRLAALFACEVTAFERKRYLNLSHEANKAMNLNSYIGLIGKHLRERPTEDGLLLEKTHRYNADLHVPDAKYFITLDADSLLLPEYAPRLVHMMEQAGNKRLAVIQTPYSAIPGASNPIERIAGATTDIQYIIHQGFTRHNATYWVGANALLRHEALLDIAENDTERGFPIQRFIQDRTVIEDTESSVDLIARGWRLYNYPERLAYSATPPDFGSLLIQRRRWANGGLIILPKLLRFLAVKPQRKIAEGFLRVHYLVSIAAVNIGLLAMLAFPFTDSVHSAWLPLTALPYFLLYGRDLLLSDYRGTDLLRVYALNLLLIPVNLGGVLKSVQQAFNKKKIPFGRTPKVQGRTATPVFYLLMIYVLLLYWLIGAGFDFATGYRAHGTFALVNAAFLAAAIVSFIGLRASREDIVADLRSRQRTATPVAPQAITHEDHQVVAFMLPVAITIRADDYAELVEVDTERNESARKYGT